jgi:phosphoribosylglycinamide formyltransferase-1
LQALIDAERGGRLGQGAIAAVIADRECYALERAAAAGIPAWLEAQNKALPLDERRLDLSGRILARALSAEAQALVLAGFLSILQGEILETYRERIINLHPALLPKFGGLYGINVHRAVLAAGETESGCTIHYVDSGTDTGPILLQRRAPVLPGDTPETLAGRVGAEEHIAIVQGVCKVLARINLTEKKEQK